MSVPRADYDPRRIFLISCPSLPMFKHRRAIGIYTAGALVRHRYGYLNNMPMLIFFRYYTFMKFQRCFFSLPLHTPSSLTPAHYPLMPVQVILTTQSKYTLPLSTGFQESSRLLVCSSSTSLTKSAYSQKAHTAVNPASYGEQDYSSLLDSRSWLVV
jgi:hypothetical protein